MLSRDPYTSSAEQMSKNILIAKLQYIIMTNRSPLFCLFGIVYAVLHLFVLGADAGGVRRHLAGADGSVPAGAPGLCGSQRHPHRHSIPQVLSFEVKPPLSGVLP